MSEMMPAYVVEVLAVFLGALMIPLVRYGSLGSEAQRAIATLHYALEIWVICGPRWIYLLANAIFSIW